MIIPKILGFRQFDSKKTVDRMKAHSINGSTLVQNIWIGVERNHTVLLIIPIFSNLSNYFYREYIFKKYVFYKEREPQQGESFPYEILSIAGVYFIIV
ncbi:hypothetical protein AYJ08_13725 [Brevibacillus sp. SKDU10]|nr:hypothetical protein AYJ08_13725 [Brevibacillus sp. SKDU10]